MSGEERPGERFPVRCVVHDDCASCVPIGIACANETVPMMVKNGLVLVKPSTRTDPDAKLDWHRPCDECARVGAIKIGDGRTIECGFGLMYCCSQQWQDPRYLCAECGESGIYHLFAHALDGREERWHLQRGEVGDVWCGPVRPDPNCPGYWKRFGPRSR